MGWKLALLILFGFAAVDKLYAAPRPDFGAAPPYKLDPSTINDKEIKELDLSNKNLPKLLTSLSRVCVKLIAKKNYSEAKKILQKMCEVVKKVDPKSTRASLDVTWTIRFIMEQGCSTRFIPEIDKLMQVSELSLHKGIDNKILLKSDYIDQKKLARLYSMKKKRFSSNRKAVFEWPATSWLYNLIEFADSRKAYKDAIDFQTKMVEIAETERKKQPLILDRKLETISQIIKLIRFQVLSGEVAKGKLEYKSILKYFPKEMDKNMFGARASMLATLAEELIRLDSLSFASEVILDSFNPKLISFVYPQKRAIHNLLRRYKQKNDLKNYQSFLRKVIEAVPTRKEYYEQKLLFSTEPTNKEGTLEDF